MRLLGGGRGGKGQPSSSETKRVHSIHELISTRHIRSTSSMVSEINALDDGNNRDENLEDCVHRYVEQINQTRKITVQHLVEYTELRHLIAESTRAKQSMGTWFQKFAILFEDETINRMALINCLSLTLKEIAINAINAEHLMHLAKLIFHKSEQLLAQLEDEDNNEKEALLIAMISLLHDIFFYHLLDVESDVSEWNAILETYRRMIKSLMSSGRHFAMNHCALIIEGNLRRMNAETIKRHQIIRIRPSLGATQYHQPHQMSWLFAIEGFDRESFQKSMGSSSQFNEWLLAIISFAADVLELPSYFDVFLKFLQSLMERESALEREERKHVRYELLRQLEVIACNINDISIAGKAVDTFFRFLAVWFGGDGFDQALLQLTSDGMYRIEKAGNLKGGLEGMRQSLPSEIREVIADAYEIIRSESESIRMEPKAENIDVTIFDRIFRKNRLNLFTFDPFLFRSSIGTQPTHFFYSFQRLLQRTSSPRLSHLEFDRR